MGASAILRTQAERAQLGAPRVGRLAGGDEERLRGPATGDGPEVAGGEEALDVFPGAAGPQAHGARAIERLGERWGVSAAASAPRPASTRSRLRGPIRTRR